MIMGAGYFRLAIRRLLGRNHHHHPLLRHGPIFIRIIVVQDIRMGILKDLLSSLDYP